MDPFIAITLFAIGVLAGVITTKIFSSIQLPLIIANAKSEIETELATTGQQLEHANEQLREASNSLGKFR